MIVSKKKNRRKFKIKNDFRIIFDINANRKKQQHDKLTRQKLVNKRWNHEFEEHEQNIIAQFNKLISIRQQIVVEIQEC
jgi:hypothetical protein